MLRRPHYILMGMVVLLALAVLNLPGRVSSQLKLAIGTLFVPLFGVAGSTHQLVEKAGNRLVPRGELLQQIQRLETENQQLRLKMIQAEAAFQENSRFREYYGWRKQTAWNAKLARVIGRDPANWWRTLRIDLGTRDGIPLNAPVFIVQGLVGRVSEIGPNQSQVVLVGDPDCRVSVVVEETLEHGVIAPATANPIDPTLVDLLYLPRNARLRGGLRVYTSGEGGIFPQRLLVGSLVDFRTVDYGLYTEGRVKLAVNMNALEEVWVKLP